jgi:hypothetical protein
VHSGGRRPPRPRRGQAGRLQHRELRSHRCRLDRSRRPGQRADRAATRPTSSVHPAERRAAT